MMRYFSATLLFLLITLPLTAQEEESAEYLFYEADYWFTEEENYEEAAYLFKRVLNMEPDNANVKFMLGMCYNNIRGMEEEAIPYFREATQDISLKWKPSKYKIKQAPHHSWYYLADTYRKLNRLDEALEALQTFSSLKNFEKYYNVSLTEDATTKIERAKIIRDAELNLRALYFNEPINTPNDDYSGVISADGKMMVWASSKAFYQGVFMSRRDGTKWTVPVEITPQIGSDGNMFPTGLSADGSMMLLVYRPIRGDSDIWYTEFDGMYWSIAQPLHGAINTNANEEHASFSPNGNRIYLTTDRRGGVGGLDIWYSDKQGDGQWGEPINMGDVINTREDETCAYIAPGEGRFIFASKGHFNMGGYDIFRCEIQSDGSWGEPTNIGYPINTTGDDTYYVPLNEGLSALYSRFTTEAIGMTDLWYVMIEGEKGFVSDGLILAMDTRAGLSAKDFAIIVVDESTGEEIEILYDAKSDTFKALAGPDKTYKVISYKQQ